MPAPDVANDNEEVRFEDDADFINRVVNAPSVRELADHFPEQPIDVAPAIDHGVFVSNGADAVMVFEPWFERARVFKAFAFFEDTCRGDRARRTARAMVDLMRPQADSIFGLVPISSPRLAAFVRDELGFRSLGLGSYPGDGEAELFHMDLDGEPA